MADTHFHFCRMDIHIQFFCIQFKMERGKWKFMDHGKGLVGLFDGLRDDRTFNITPVDKIVFKGPVSAAYERFADKTVNMHAHVAAIDRQKV